MATKILVLSTTNSTLGPMAQGFLDYYSSKKTKVVSAALQPDSVHKMSLKVMDSLGIPVGDLRVPYTEVKDLVFDYVFTFSEKAKSQAEVDFPNAIRKHLTMDSLDHFHGTDKELKKAFKDSRNEIQKACIAFVEDHVLLAKKYR